MKYFFLIALSLCILSPTVKAQEVYEGIDYSQPDPTEESFKPREKSKTNIICQSHIELIFNSTGSGGSMAGVNYILTPQLLVGVHFQRVNTMKSESGGDLDNGQYYISEFGFTGTGTFVGAKFFLKDYGIQSHGVFFAGQYGRTWGKYSFTQDRYTRENGFINNLFGDDKKLAESSSDQSSTFGDVIRGTVGYSFPFVDGILVKGVSLQLQAGIEQSTLPDSKYLSTKFATKDVGSSVKSNLYLDIGVSAYF